MPNIPITRKVPRVSLPGNSTILQTPKPPPPLSSTPPLPNTNFVFFFFSRKSFYFISEIYYYISVYLFIQNKSFSFSSFHLFFQKVLVPYNIFLVSVLIRFWLKKGDERSTRFGDFLGFLEFWVLRKIQNPLFSGNLFRLWFFESEYSIILSLFLDESVLLKCGFWVF